MDSLKKSFKSHVSSYKYRRPSLEEQPILSSSDHRNNHDDDDGDDSDRRGEVVVKIDGNSRELLSTSSSSPNVNMNANGAVWRESSYDFTKEGQHLRRESEGQEFSFPSQHYPPQQQMAEIVEDPPSRLISSFLHKQRAAGVEMALDMDLEMDELKTIKSSSSPSKEVRVSFVDHPSSSSSSSSSCDDVDEDPSHRSQEVRLRRGKGIGRPRCSSPPSDQDGSGVIRCTSSASYQQQMSGLLGRTKTRSRLMDPPPPSTSGMEANDRKSGRFPTKSGQLKSGQLKSGQLKSGLLKSGQLKSGLLGKYSSRYDEDDEDPFVDDIPENFKKEKFNVLTIVQWVSLILIMAALGCSLWIPFLEGYQVWDLHLWKWELMVLVLICGRLLSGWVIRFNVYFIERNFFLRKRLLYFVYGVRKAVQNCLWLGLVLLVWHLIFDKKVERATKSTTLPYVTKVLLCLLIAALLRLIKTLLVKVLASSFHVSTYFDRIQESLFNQYIIETLSGPPLIEIRHNIEEDDRVMAELQKLQNAGANIPSDLSLVAQGNNGRVTGNSGSVNGPRRSSQFGPTKSFKFSGPMSKKDVSKEQDGITINQLHKLNQKNVSAWNMKRLMRIVRYGTLTTLDEQLGHVNGEDESAVQIRSEHEAIIAAKKIFSNVAKPGSKYIYLVDLMRFMREDEALKTMILFEGAKDNSKVSRKCLKNWVVNAFRERRHLALTLNDTKTAVNKLHQMANVIVGIIIVSIWLLILNIANSHFFVVIGSQLLLAVFMFGNTLKMIFEAIIFLFVMHPFDVGDRCEINGVQMVVEEMNILTTIFLRFDNQKVTCPNNQLATLFIGNYYRSPDMGDSIDFCIHVSTPVEKIAIMKQRLISYMESRPEHWYPSPQIVFREVDDMNRLRISIWMRHTINFQDMGLKWERRELVMQEMIKVLSELEIEYRMLPVDVNVRNMPAITSNRLPSTWKTCS